MQGLHQNILTERRSSGKKLPTAALMEQFQPVVLQKLQLHFQEKSTVLQFSENQLRQLSKRTKQIKFFLEMFKGKKIVHQDLNGGNLAKSFLKRSLNMESPTNIQKLAFPAHQIFVTRFKAQDLTQ